MSSERGFRSSWRSAEHGFTLIETLVALAIFSLAALALLRLEGVALGGAARIDTRAVGRIVARNLAVELLSDPRAPAVGEESGSVDNGGRNWTWRRATARTDDARIVRIDLSVADAPGRPAGALTLARPVQ